MRRITVFGAGGQLGEAVIAAARRRGIDALAFDHSDIDISDLEAIRSLATRDASEVWINCAGVLRGDQYGGKQHNLREMIAANAYGPHVLAETGRRLIHISTDSVFNGLEGSGISNALHAEPKPNDIYGVTKYLGEYIATQPNVTVLRCSFVGARQGLLRMLLDKANQEGVREVAGHANSFWSGSTVKAVADAILDMLPDPPLGLQHLATPIAISKAQMLREIIAAYQLDVEVIEQERPVIYRGLIPTITLKPFALALAEELDAHPLEE